MIGLATVIDKFEDLPKKLLWAESAGTNGLQFGFEPTSGEIMNNILTESTIQQIQRIQQRNQMFLIMHGKYLYNFCRENVEYQVGTLIDEIQIAQALNSHLIIHQGKNVEKLTKIQAINNYVQRVSDAIERTNTSLPKFLPHILLENSAAQGTEIGYSLNEIAYIYNQFDENVRERIGFCLDTCHAFAAGQLDLRDASKVIEYLTQINELMNPKALQCIHLNDSGVPFGYGRDYHGDLLGGYITNPMLGGSSDGISVLIQYAQKHQIPMVLETPCNLSDILPQQINWQMDIINHWLNPKNSLIKQEWLNISQFSLSFIQQTNKYKKK